MKVVFGFVLAIMIGIVGVYFFHADRTNKIDFGGIPAKYFQQEHIDHGEDNVQRPIVQERKIDDMDEEEKKKMYREQNERIIKELRDFARKNEDVF